MSRLRFPPYPYYQLAVGRRQVTALLWVYASSLGAHPQGCVELTSAKQLACRMRISRACSVAEAFGLFAARLRMGVRS